MTLRAATGRDAPGPSEEVSTEVLLGLHRTMLLIRLAEEKLAAEVLAGEIRCPVHLYTGEEAVAAGVCAHLGADDYVFGTHRSHGHYLAKGGDLNAMMAEIYGRITGCASGRGGSMHLVDTALHIYATPIVSSTISNAVGASLAASIKEGDFVAVAFFGDGATEEGRFYESLNLAAIYRLPTIFVCENNLYASHLPLLDRQFADNIDERAKALGVPSIRVEGNDACAVYTAAGAAVERAKAGGGPTLIECRTYRWRGHVGPHDDIDKGLRDPNELAAWKEKCPIRRAERVLLERGALGVDDAAKVWDELERQVEAAIEFAKGSSRPEPSTLLSFVYSDKTRGCAFEVGNDA